MGVARSPIRALPTTWNSAASHFFRAHDPAVASGTRAAGGGGSSAPSRCAGTSAPPVARIRASLPSSTLSSSTDDSGHTPGRTETPRHISGIGVRPGAPRAFSGPKLDSHRPTCDTPDGNGPPLVGLWPRRVSLTPVRPFLCRAYVLRYALAPRSPKKSDKITPAFVSIGRVFDDRIPALGGALNYAELVGDLLGGRDDSAVVLRIIRGSPGRTSEHRPA